MIGRIRGILELKNPPFLLIDVVGVGYEIQAPLSTIYRLPALGDTITLLTHHYVREDIAVLYGFIEEKERALFRALIKISGVGPKMALSILSGLDVAVFMRCIEHKDHLPLTRLPGVGKKTAERLILEMSGKLDKLLLGESDLWPILQNDSLDPGKNAENEAISALIALGYKPQEASRAVAKIELKGLTAPEIIRKALQKVTT